MNKEQSLTTRQIVSLLRQEIRWCNSYSKEKDDFQRGFIRGLKQAILIARTANLKLKDKRR